MNNFLNNAKGEIRSEAIVEQPLVSVVIIFFNEERFLQEAIKSVLSQTYKEWELLLVDDGSTDGSPEIALRVAKQNFNRVRYLHHGGQQNLGMSASRNLGIFHSMGKYIAFLDADDVWVPDILKDQAAILESKPEAGMVFGPIMYWFGWASDQENCERDYVENLGVEPNTLVQPPTLLALFLQNKATVPSGLLVRREIIGQVRGFEDIFRGEYEDQVFCAKICLQWPVYASGECWYKYRQHPNSSVAAGRASGRTILARQFFLNWLKTYLIEKKIRNPQVWQALWHELMPYAHPTLYRLSTYLKQYLGSVYAWIKLILSQ